MITHSRNPLKDSVYESLREPRTLDEIARDLFPDDLECDLRIRKSRISDMLKRLRDDDKIIVIGKRRMESKTQNIYGNKSISYSNIYVRTDCYKENDIHSRYDGNVQSRRNARARGISFGTHIQRQSSRAS